MEFIFFATLLLFSINGFAQNWEFVVKSKDGDTFYIDIDNIKKHKGLVYYWMLVDRLEPTTIGVNSSISKFKVDCVIEKLTRINSTFYSQSMGRGKIITESTPENIQYPKPNSVGYVVMKFACKNAR
tara:strand:+ start:511 stop:891 length:381 start_codon:yes stop_codon:yes gene_type:complete